MVTYSSVTLRSDLTIGGSTYEENSFHRPLFLKTRASIPTVSSQKTQTLVNVTPRKGAELSQMELPISYDLFNGMSGTSSFKLVDISYTAAGQAVRIFGWIDRAEPVAVKGPSANTRIHWHPDYWISSLITNWMSTHITGYTAAVSTGPGRVRRGPASMARPDPSNPRYWKKSAQLFDFAIAHTEGLVEYNVNGPYVIALIVKNVNNRTTFNYAWFPVWAAIPNAQYSPPSLVETYMGLLEEVMELNTQSIINVWLSPIPPTDMDTAYAAGYLVDNANTSRSYFITPYNIISAFTVYHLVNGAKQELKGGDNARITLVDPYGMHAATCPWGIGFKGIKSVIEAGVNGGYLTIVLVKDSLSDQGNISEGRVLSIPLITVPVTTNAASDYNYSGQREYDIESARIQNEQALVNGIAGAGSSAIGGAVAGSIAPGIGTAAGAVAGIAASVVSSAVNYVSNAYYNQKNQEAVDRLMSNQANTAAVSGGGLSWRFLENKWSLILSVRDDQSAAELQSEQSELGYITDSFQSDCTSLISAGGGLKIDGLEVTGDLPPEGKAYITAMFERGVHLDLIP